MWYIGQEIIAIRDHSLGRFKKGDEFKINSLKKGCCSVIIDIGHREGVHYFVCLCGKKRLENDSVYYDELCFKPKDYILNMSFNEAVELVSNNKSITQTL